MVQSKSSIFFIPDYTVGTGITPVQQSAASLVDFTTGRDLHPAPEDESYYILYLFLVHTYYTKFTTIVNIWI